MIEHVEKSGVQFFLAGVDMNNVMFFDEMNILPDEKKRRIEMANYLQRRIVQTFRRRGLKHLESDDELFMFRIWLKSTYSIFCRKYGFDDSIIDEYSVLFATMICIGMMESNNEKYAFSVERAGFIARNEVNRISNRSDHEKAKISQYKYHIWEAEIDKSTREWHIEADGQRKPINEPFYVGGEYLMFPMDTSLGATAQNILNCRCVERFE